MSPLFQILRGLLRTNCARLISVLMLLTASGSCGASLTDPETKDARQAFVSFANSAHEPTANEGRVVKTGEELTTTDLNTTMEFNIVFRLKAEDALRDRIYRGEILNRTQLEAYLPTKAQYDNLKVWLLAQGFQITKEASTRHAIYALGPARLIRQAFGGTLAIVQSPNGETYPALVSPPSLPAALAECVEGFRGLQPHSRPKPQYIGKNSAGQTVICVSPYDLETAFYQAPTNPDGSLTYDGTGETVAIVGDNFPDPASMQSMWQYLGMPVGTVTTAPTPVAAISIINLGSGYTSAPTVTITGDGTGAVAVSYIDGTGAVSEVQVTNAGQNYTTATVALTGGGGTGATASAAVGQFTIKFPEGNTFTSGIDAESAFFPVEEDLDIEEVHGIAPGANIRLYFSFTDVLNDLPNNPSIHQVSLSSGPPEYEIPRDPAIPLLAALGINIFVASGDDGSSASSGGQEEYNPTGALTVNYPASDPLVTAVGGTTVHGKIDWSTDPEGGATVGTGVVTKVAPETAWSLTETNNQYATGGGVSVLYQRPPWQTGQGVPPGTGRCVPDVAAQAYWDVNTTEVVGDGTSVATPTWAALCAIINQARAKVGLSQLGLLGPQIYPLLGTKALNVVSPGGFTINSTSSTMQTVVVPLGTNGAYNAGPEGSYDLLTGLGTPNLANLIAVFTVPCDCLDLVDTGHPHRE